MGVNYECADYEANKTVWQRCRNVMGGEDEVKKAGAAYLPMLGGQEPEQYEAYKTRAMYYNATARTVKGLCGAILRKIPKVTVPKEMEEANNNIGPENQSLLQQIGVILEEVIGMGRVGLLVDAAERDNDQPFLALYYAENITNWKTSMINGRLQLTLVVLKECATEPKAGDAFDMEEIPQYRVLILDTAGLDPVYRQQIWRKKEKASKGTQSDDWEQIGADKTPKRKGGGTFNYIPFVFVNPTGTTWRVEKSPLLDLVNVNLSHYRTSADLEHGRHFTALPVPWAAGFDTKGKNLTVGSGVAWLAEDPQAHAGYLEFSGAGLLHLSNAMAEKERLMAVLGARLLEEQAKANETATAVMMRQSGEQTTLTAIATAVSEACTMALKWVAEWSGKEGGDISVVCTADIPIAIDSTMLIALMTALQSSAISYDTWFYNLQRGEIVPDDRTADDEKELISLGNPMATPPQGTDANGNPQDTPQDNPEATPAQTGAAN